MKSVGLLIFILVLLLLGIACIFFPEKIQEIAVKSVSQGYLTKNSPLESFIKSNKYLVIVRSVGIIAILCGCFLVFAFIKGLYG